MISRNRQTRGHDKIYVKPCQTGIAKWGDLFDMYEEPESPSGGGGCLRQKFKGYRNRQIRGVFNIHGEPVSPNKGTCLRCMMDRCRQMRGRV